MPPFSVLDLAPVVQGSGPGEALRNALDLARRAERWGYRRYWMAEHHNMPGVASAATAVALAHVAAATSTIRIGAGGIMLPNHAPLVIAEQFGTLAALHPGRIDLGVGRAPGTDGLTARALRRTLQGEVDDFPQDVLELIGYFAPVQPGQRVAAVPGAGLNVPVWILGSSLYGAQLAAVLGPPYAFASHFAPRALEQALHVYRRDFRPSAYLARPYAAAGLNVFAADTDAEAELLATSVQQAFVNLRTGRAGPLPPPTPGYADTLPPEARAMLAEALSCTAVGAPETVRGQLQGFIARTAVDELILTSQTYDHLARLRSFEIAAEVLGVLGQERAAEAA
ncbi:MAG: LLM class flavin-dependent oxidoreductase [Proteobacteria bacterium]|nr:LLM class flavin-dependent oxidoreductase [Pseudomonadota bacterium]